MQRSTSRCDSGPGRAISAGQLEDLHDFFKDFILLRNMYYVVSNLVLPLTEDVRLSYAEMVGPRCLDWFVSHYWGDPFRHLVSAVREHALTVAGHSGWREQGYWICSFSNNQYEVEAELGDGQWEKSSFYLALTSTPCRGTLMVLDQQVKPLTRAWCLFEVLQTLLRQGSGHSSPSASSSGGSDFQGLLLGTSSGVLNKGHGGPEIAMAIARSLLVLDLRTADASDEADLAMIQGLVERMPGGFDAVNGFVQGAIHTALVRVRERFEQDCGQLVCLLGSRQAPAPPQLSFAHSLTLSSGLGCSPPGSGASSTEAAAGAAGSDGEP